MADPIPGVGDEGLSPEQLAEGKRLLSGYGSAAHAPWKMYRSGAGRYGIGNPVGPIAANLSDANAAAIVWLRNHAPALLATAERAQRQTERLHVLEHVAGVFAGRLDAGYATRDARRMMESDLRTLLFSIDAALHPEEEAR